MPSMVVIAWPTAALTGITQLRLGLPSRFTVQAPHSATPQPNFVPFMPRRSRKTHRSGMSGGASTSCDLPLIFSVSTLTSLLVCEFLAKGRHDAVSDSLDGPHQLHVR